MGLIPPFSASGITVSDATGIICWCKTAEMAAAVLTAIEYGTLRIPTPEQEAAARAAIVDIAENQP